MPTGVSNKKCRIFFINIIVNTFPDKEAHKRIICYYILKLEITESNNIEAFQCMARHTPRLDKRHSLTQPMAQARAKHHAYAPKLTGGIRMPSNNGWTSTSTVRTPKSVSTTMTADRSIISYDITQTKHKFTKSNNDTEKTNDNVWIVISHAFLPTCWCPKCNKWASHPDSLHEVCTRWKNDKAAHQVGKQDQTKIPNNYGPTNQNNRNYERDDDRKRSSKTYDRDRNHDKRSCNDRGRSPSHGRSNSQTRSPRSPGDSHKDNYRQGASFFNGKNGHAYVANADQTIKRTQATEKQAVETSDFSNLKQYRRNKRKTTKRKITHKKK
jgi:hypothetical protein